MAFCIRGHQFPESIEYRKRIIELLGLERVSQTEGGEVEVRPGDQDHCERMWSERLDMPGRSFEIVHLNDTLAPYNCWISAVYHTPSPDHVTQRVDVEGRLIRVDPLIRWSKDEIRAFMREHKLPFHPRAIRPKPAASAEDQPPLPSYNY